METITVKGEKRDGLGKVATRNARKQGLIPAVIYGGDSNVSFSTITKEVKPLIYTPEFKLADVNVDGESHKCIVKDIQFHPVTDAIMHIDFLKLVDGHPIKVEVPVEFEGVSPGVKSGGKLIQQIRRIKIKTVPAKLIDKLSVNISELELGGAVRVRDISAVDGIEILVNEATPVATVEVPRALKSAEAAEAVAAGAGEATEEASAE